MRTEEATEDLVAALTREHHEIDAGIEAFMTSLDRGEPTAEPLLGAMQSLRRHIYLEETFLFPPLRAAGMMMPIMVMLREHGELWRAMDGFADLLPDVPTGPETPPATEQLLARCRELLVALEQHNSKEEPVVYPRAETDLTAEASAELAEFLRTGETPEGWICHQAAS